jgi:transcriptional regulator with XRE-family HTH domain
MFRRRFIATLSFLYFFLMSLDIHLERLCREVPTELLLMPKPHNFLKMYRKRAGLTQAEAAKLIGSRDRLQFARYERHLVDPPLRMAVACEQVFGVPVSELFAGLNQEVNAMTLRRTRSLKERLVRAAQRMPTSRRLLQKLEWVSDRLAAWFMRNPLQTL